MNLYTPVTKSGQARRKLREAVSKETGRMWCPSCSKYKDSNTVKIYRSAKGTPVVKCDDCLKIAKSRRL